MKLETYLAREKMLPSAFALKIGTPASTVTRLLKGERSPGIDLIAKIRTATGGDVTPDDFLPASHPAPAPKQGQAA